MRISDWSSDVCSSDLLRAIDRLPAERPQGEEEDVEAGPPPGDADDRDEHQDGGQQPSGGHGQPAEDEPEEVEDEGEHGNLTGPERQEPTTAAMLGRADRRQEPSGGEAAGVKSHPQRTEEHTYENKRIRS